METKRKIVGCCAAVAAFLCLPVNVMASAEGGAGNMAPVKFQVAVQEGLIAFRPTGGVVRIGAPIVSRLPDFRSWLPVPVVTPMAVSTNSTLRFVRMLPPARVRP